VPFSQIDTYETLNGLETHGATAYYNTYGAETEAEVWDFASGTTARGGLLRKELWTYGYSIAGLPTQDEVYDGSGNEAGNTTYGYDATTPTASSGVPQHIAVTGPRGNLTNESLYASASTAYALSATYEDTGSLLTSTTPTGTTTLTYDSTFVYNTGASLPTPSSGVAISASASFDTTYTGLPLTTTDPNSQETKTPTYDPMLRPTEIEYPDGGQINWAYTPTTLTTTTLQTPNPTAASEVQLDGYSRQSRTEVANGQSGNDYYQQDTCYDANGNSAFSSYSYQGVGFGATKGCTVSGSTVSSTVNGDASYYDVLGRLTKLVRQDGETRTYTYSGRDVESVDENGVTRVVQVDGLGRNSVICEITSTALQGVSPVSCGTDISGTGFLTTYSYALATGTTTVTQGAQTRTFQSDWLGRPTLVQEPESGKTTYSYAYNSTGLVVTRTRPKANQTSSTVTTTTTTQYDALNRPLSLSYSDGTPTKTFAYDKAAGVSTGSGAPFTDLTQTNLIGRLSMASVPLAATAYSYDPLGRTSYLDECLPSGPCGTSGVPYNRQLHFVYDLAGNPVSSSDGAGVTSTYTVSAASELLSLTSSISNSTNPASIISNVQNGPNGPVNYNLGNGLSSVKGYDTLGRPDGGWVCAGSTSASCTGGTQVYGFTNGWKGVQLQSSSDSVLGQTSTYAYDAFNRLASRTVTSGTGPNYGWVYDRYANRWQQNITGGTGSGPTISVSFNAGTNQISTSGYTYDAAGNMNDDSFHSYTYDGENNLTQVDSSTASYVYNALNQRVRTVVGSSTTEFVFNAAGQRVSTWNGSTRTELLGKYYWGNTPAAFYTTASNPVGAAAHFEHQDWLGTERIRTTYNGGVEGEFTSLPFGDGQTTISGTDLDANHYGLLDYDSETETDHAQFRQYSNAQGHWMSPDPYSGSYNLGDPQSFNRYGYGNNNPLGLIDPSGLTPIGYYVECDTYGDAGWGGDDTSNTVGVVAGYTVCFYDGSSGAGAVSGGGSQSQAKMFPPGTVEAITQTCYNATQLSNTLGNWAKADAAIATGVGTVGVLSKAGSFLGKYAPEVALVFGTTAAVEGTGSQLAGWVANASCPQE